MPVQITPFNPTNLSDLAINKRNFNAQQNQLGVQNAQRDRQLDQSQSRLKISQDQLEMAAKESGLKREDYLFRVLDEAATQVNSKEELVNYMSSRFEVFDPRAVEHIPDWRIGQALRQEQFEREKLSRQGTKVLGPDQSLIDAAGNVIATGPEKRPTVTEQMKIEDQAKAKEAKGRDRDLIASTAASLLESGDFKDAFGTVDSLAPTVLASTADAEADIDRLVSLLSLGAREKLKGTGQISDFESKQLEKSASILSDRTISDEKAQKELENIAEIFGGIRPRKNAIGVKSGRFTIRAK